MSAHRWTCPCGEIYELEAEVGRPVFFAARRGWRVRATVCGRCRRNLRKTRREQRQGVQQELGSVAA